MTQTLTAIGDTIIAKIIYSKKIGSIYIPESGKKYNADYYGEIISIGPENTKNIKIGDKIIFPRHEGFEFEHEEEQYICLRNKWIEAVREEE